LTVQPKRSKLSRRWPARLRQWSHSSSTTRRPLGPVNPTRLPARASGRRLWPAIGVICSALVLPLSVMVASPAARADDCDVRGTVERPTEDAVVTNQPVVISGWAADIGAESGTGISEVRIALDADPDQGGVAVPALYGWQRADVADLLSSPRFAATGLALSWNATGVAPGRHTLYIQARSACGWITVTRTVLVAGQSAPTTAASPTPTRPAAPGATTPGGTAPSGATGPTGPAGAPTRTPTPAVPRAQ
jgi:hypothetical protein